MATREELIKQCRYYKGEEECPSIFDAELSWFWDVERVYVQSGGVFSGEAEYYKAISGRHYTSIPDALIHIMFTSWAKSTFAIKRELPKFYRLISQYLMVADDHYPQDKIPS